MLLDNKSSFVTIHKFIVGAIVTSPFLIQKNYDKGNVAPMFACHPSGYVLKSLGKVVFLFTSLVSIDKDFS